MKVFSLLLLCMTMIACDPHGFGFKNNPAYILDQALESIREGDETLFTKVTDREALCIYGNAAGMTYLRQNVTATSSSVDLSWTVTESHFKLPEYVGFWSYYQSRYTIDVKDKKTDASLAEVTVDCHYGTKKDKDDELLDLTPARYPVKECRLIRITPKTFEALPLPSECEILKV